MIGHPDTNSNFELCFRKSELGVILQCRLDHPNYVGNKSAAITKGSQDSVIPILVFDLYPDSGTKKKNSLKSAHKMF